MHKIRPQPCDNLAGEMGLIGELASQPQRLAVAIMLLVMLGWCPCVAPWWPLGWCWWCKCAHKAMSTPENRLPSAQ